MPKDSKMLKVFSWSFAYFFSIFFLDLHYPSLSFTLSDVQRRHICCGGCRVDPGSRLECKGSIEIDSSFGFGHIIVVIMASFFAIMVACFAANVSQI